MFNGAEMEKELAAYALELGGIEEKIKHPKNEHKSLRLFKHEGRIFLIMHEKADPLVVDFFVHPEILKRMIEQYETAAQSDLIDKKRAVQLVLTDQFSMEDLKSFVFQSFEAAGA